MSFAVNYAERRRFERKVPSEPISVQDSVTQENLGTLGNISAQGLMLIGRREISEGLLLQLEFSVEGTDGKHAHVAIGAESLWCSPALRPESFWTGFKIIDISSEDVQLIEDLLDQL